MKIHDKLAGGQDTTLGAQKGAKRGSRDKVKGKNKKKECLTDKVDISNKVKKLLAAINQLPEIRENKVKAAKEAIESGSYKVDTLKVAEKILQEI